MGYNNKEAYNKLLQLRNLGLKEINFSTGDDHQQWVPYDNIVNGCMASMDLGLTCLVNVETHDSASFCSEKLRNDDRLLSYFNLSKYDKPLLIENGIWIPFDNKANISYDSIKSRDNYSTERCTSLFNTIPINPYSQLMSCCGLPCEYILPFRLGSLKYKTIKELYETQFQDLIKIWIFVDGPRAVLKYIYKKRELEIDIPKSHICHICAEIFKDQENIEIIKANYEEIMPSVIFKFMLLKPTFE